MNKELILSSDLHVIVAEINSYKQIAGQSIFEIGRRLKHVKENDLVHGEWMDWCKTKLNFSSEQANKYITVYDRFSNYELTSSLSVDALYLITSLSDEQITKSHTIPSTGESKSVDEMTVRELREVKAQLKRKDQELEQQKRVNEGLLETVESFQNVKEVVKEVTPEHVEKELKNLKDTTEQRKNAIVRLTEERDDFERKLKEIEKYQKSEQAEIDQLRRQKEKLDLEAHISISSLQINIHKFIQENSPNVFLQGAVASSTFWNKDDLLDSVIALEEFTKTLRDILNSEINDRFTGKREIKQIIDVTPQ